MSKAFTTGLAALAACALFACGGGGEVVDGSSSDTDKTEPTLWAGDNGSTTTTDESRVTDTREDLVGANGAAARIITNNHPEAHALMISALDLASGRHGTFALSEGGGALGELHSHAVSLTAQQLGEIRDGAQLTVESTVGGARGGHTHTVTIARR